MLSSFTRLFNFIYRIYAPYFFKILFYFFFIIVKMFSHYYPAIFLQVFLHLFLMHFVFSILSFSTCLLTSFSCNPPCVIENETKNGSKKKAVPYSYIRRNGVYNLTFCVLFSFIRLFLAFPFLCFVLILSLLC